MRLISILLFSFFICGQVQAEGIEFYEGKWKEALAEAKKQDKLIFIDAYTTWCGPCKRMAAQIFPLKDVGDFYNANFVNMKYDMEKGEGRTIRSLFGVNSFPTFLWVNGDGKLVHKAVGGKPAEQFIQLGKSALSRFDRSAQYESKYIDGNREPDFLYDYAIALAKSNKSNVKVSNEYLKTQKDLSSERNLQFLYGAVSESDTKLFSLFTKHQSAIEALYSPEDVANKIDKACHKTVDKAINYKSRDLLNEAIENYSTANPAQSQNFKLDSELKFSEAAGVADDYLKTCEQVLKIKGKSNPEVLTQLAASALKNYPDNTKIMSKANAWAAKGASKGGDYNSYFTLAGILLQNGKKADALEAAEKALLLARDGKKNQTAVNLLLKKIKNS